ncbi:MAG: twin-arginine translocase TatA/TatE family subunit [Chloroflexi bacterium]|nr:twin-arginine translocase TatA/TatE family subunit [Chloroflexota bacterium]
MPFKIGPLELVIILLIVIAIFGAGKLASVGGSIGKAVKDFRTAVKEPEKDENKQEASTTPVVPPPTTTNTSDSSSTTTKVG